ncbi:MAG: hypothetical protein HOE54_02615 [Gammaproteobacteria bacterium]|jgi:hypothetical protein|nr:hypothetical protein [Gammaproteobacteria bacterium]MBT7369405.1 hypothetical protein [Gammaproteobacteria bacterium]
MDIVTRCGVPRYLHNDLPLGNPLGPPGDRDSQRLSVERALKLAAEVNVPHVEISDLTWPGDGNWKSAYARIDDENKAALLKMGEENRQKKAEDKDNGLFR